MNYVGLGEPYGDWLQGQIDLAQADLFECLVEDTRHRSHEVFRRRPRLIRAVDDKWGPTPENAEYNSPLPVLVLDYVRWYLQDQGQAFVFRPEKHKERNPELGDQYDTFLTRFRDNIRRRLRKALEDEEDELIFPTWKHFEESDTWLRGLFDSNALDAGKAAEMLARARKDRDASAMLRLMILSRFILNRVVMTLVESKREDYALDMFDSLNTTGEPLTALETFKPRVIHGEGGIGLYRDSASKRHFDKIDEYLAAEDARNEATIAKSIVTTFALAETGDKIGSKLSEQRNYLRDEYSNIADDAEARVAMTRQLERTSALSLLVWSKTPDDRDQRLKGEHGITREGMFYLDVLRRTKHEITLALLSRYYDLLITDRTPSARDGFVDACQTLLAFWTLWRSSADGTRGIDSAHRNLMAEGLPSDGEPKLLGALARSQGNALPGTEQLSAALCQELAERRNIQDRKSYVQRASKVPIGKAQNLARFLVLAAHDGQTVDEKRPGLTKRGRLSPQTETLNAKVWLDDDRYRTLEHIAPSNPQPEETIDHQIYVRERYQLLGNLTALPVDLNTSLGNRSWNYKATVYEALCSEDAEDARRVLDESSLTFTEPTKERIVEKAAVIPLLRPLLTVDEWQWEMVEERTEHMLGIVWDNISPWLGLRQES